MLHDRTTAPADQRARKPRSLVPLLSVLVLAQLALYAGLRAPELLAGTGWRPPTDQAAIRMALWRRQMGDPALDPAIGTRLPALSLRGLRGGSVNLARFDGRPVAVLMVGDGEGCSTKSLMSAWALLRKTHPRARLLAVADARSENLDRLCRGERLQMEVAVDSGLALSKALNARWKPRAYLFDSRERLCYVQPDTTLNPQAVEETARRLAQFARAIPQRVARR